MFPLTQPSAGPFWRALFPGRSHCAVGVVRALDTLTLWATCPLGLGAGLALDSHAGALTRAARRAADRCADDTSSDTGGVPKT